MQGLPGRPGEKGSQGEPVSTENGREQHLPVLLVLIIDNIHIVNLPTIFNSQM